MKPPEKKGKNLTMSEQLDIIRPDIETSAQFSFRKALTAELSKRNTDGVSVATILAQKKIEYLFNNPGEIDLMEISRALGEDKQTIDAGSGFEQFISAVKAKEPSEVKEVTADKGEGEEQ